MTEMADLDHTNPHTGESFAETFRRGRVVAADGGEAGAGPPETPGGGADEARDVAEEEMEDVEHESPTDGAVRSFERGTEGRDRTV